MDDFMFSFALGFALGFVLGSAWDFTEKVSEAAGGERLLVNLMRFLMR